jgi:ubiquinone/menaquinone biosynthesis C-methylase UbiE
MIDHATKASFSYGWFRFADNEVSRNWFKDSFAYIDLIPRSIMSGENKIGLDIGCGSGSDMLNIRDKFKARVVGIDLADSLAVTGKNIGERKGLYLSQADAYHLPFRDNTFDFAYSFGVLHHLPFPEKAFHAIIEKVKKGGFIVIYLYEDFSQRSKIDRILLKAANMLRLFTTRLPAHALYLLCIALAPVVLATCSLPYRFLRRARLAGAFAERIPFRHTARLDCIRADLYDRLSAPIENRYSSAQVREWLSRARLTETGVVYYRGWIAWGRKVI